MKMNKIGVFSAIVLTTLSACATGTSFSESEVSQREVPSDMVRFVVYRNNLVGAGIQPIVSINGRETGRCTPNGVFTVDVEPGEHTLSATTESTDAITLSVLGGQTVYIRCETEIGLIVWRQTLNVVDNDIGSAESSGYALTGSY